MHRDGGDHPILLFDGACNLCNAVTRFVIRHDPPPAQFTFAALQSDVARRLVAEHHLPVDGMETFVMIEDGRLHAGSTAALRLLKRMGFPWSLMYALVIVPKPLRDGMYRWVARNRYKWFGRRDQCMTPSDDVRSRFLA
jgi:predicted DCC family thiol-disulfide oxidoreductase YuxK